MSCLCDCTLRVLNALRDAVISPCCPPRDDDQPLAASSNTSNISITSSNDERVVEADLGLSNPGLDDESFTGRALSDGPSTVWRPVLRLHEQPAPDGGPHTDSGHWTNQSLFADIDLGDGRYSGGVDEVDGLGIHIPGTGAGGGGRTDTQSTTRESGYGRSLDESNGSSSPEPSVTIAFHAPPDPTNFKVVVQNHMRCWFVLRRYNEFLALQEIIKWKVRQSGVNLPQEETADRHLLDTFIQVVMLDPRIVSLSEVREFLQLDRFRDSTSSSDSSSSPIPTPPVVLDPRFLMPPGAPPTVRKPLPVLPENQKQQKQQDQTASCNSNSSTKPSLLSENSIDLGCTERKALSPKDFDFLSVIGKGSFGRVMLARYQEDNRVYAVKVLNKRMIVRRNETQHVLSERSVLIKMLNHPYLVQLHFAFTTSHKIFFVLDYVNGGELFFHLQRERIFPEPRAKFYAAEICCALDYMHSQGIVYRDLKPENILLDAEGHVVLTDFGLCKEGLQHPTSKTGTFCGTPEYLAPEILRKQPYSRAVDWWTLGAVLYEMLYGLPPFYSRDTPAMYDAILNKPLKLKQSVSTRARSLLQGLLQKDPRDRLGAGSKDGSEVKSHEFFKDIDWDLVARRGMAPPFCPTVSSETDTQNVDPMFTKEAVSQSPTSTSPTGLSASVQAVDHVFQGFSYAPPLEIGVQWQEPFSPLNNGD